MCVCVCGVCVCVCVCVCVYVKVADSKGHTLFRKEAATKGRFAFTTEDYDMFEVCFYSVIIGQFLGRLQRGTKRNCSTCWKGGCGGG